MFHNPFFPTVSWLTKAITQSAAALPPAQFVSRLSAALCIFFTTLHPTLTRSLVATFD